MDQLEWRDAFDRLFLDDAETFKEVGMTMICFTRPVAKRFVFVALRFMGREQQERRERGCRLRSLGKKKDRNIESSDVATATAADNNNLEELTTENVIGDDFTEHRSTPRIRRFPCAC